MTGDSGVKPSIVDGAGSCSVETPFVWKRSSGTVLGE